MTDAVRISRRCWAILKWSETIQHGHEYWRGGDPSQPASWQSWGCNPSLTFESRPKALAAFAQASLISQV